MAHEQNLPWELMEEILSRVPPESLVRFRTVSKQWNALFDDKTFINNHKMTFRFILAAKSKLYSVSITPKVEVRELTLDIPGLESQKVKKLVDCNGIFLCGTDKGAVVWNPWLRQTRWIDQPSLQFTGIGYQYDHRSSYKILAFYREELDPNRRYWKIYDCSTNAWKKQELISGGRSSSSSSTSSSSSNNGNLVNPLDNGGVSLNGAVFWVAYFAKTSLFFIVIFDFSVERFFIFGDLPCGENRHGDALVLSVFKGDRFSLLKQCHLTKKIEVWVTKNKIEKWYGGDLEWMNIMEVSIPNLPALVQTGSDPQPSYFIDDKKVVICSCDENGKAWIYVVGDNMLISKTQIDYVVDIWPLHCTYFPSLVPVPRVQREEAEVLV